MKVGIMGCSGYAGRQLLNILLYHKEVEIVALSSNTYAGTIGNILFDVPKNELNFKVLNDSEFINDGPMYDLVFTALPHKTSMLAVSKLLKKNNQLKIIDLSADYRFDSFSVYEQWYDCNHLDKKNLDITVYGLSELNRVKISKSQIIGNPGCYPTSILLGLLPLLGEDIIDLNSIIIDAKSGYTGAGIKPEAYKMLAEGIDNVYPYGGTNHRHIGEVEETIHSLTGNDVMIQFTPNLIPVKRGITSNIYINLTKDISHDELLEIYNNYYNEEPFVNVNDSMPKLSGSVGTNNCNIGFALDNRTNRIIITTTIDNLIKGAAGQAVQNMNLMFGICETEGLEIIKTNL